MKFKKTINAFPAIPFEDCVGKTFRSPDGRVLPGRTVKIHCIIVGYIAREIISRLDTFLKDMLPAGVEVVAASHDTGKVGPTYQEKILRAITDYLHNSHPALQNIDPKIEDRWGGHAGVSFATAKNMNAPRHIAEILGSHHGFTPVSPPVATDGALGGDEWERERQALVKSLFDEFSAEWPEIGNDAIAKAVAGLTTVADWIGSGPLFENPENDWSANIKPAVDNAGFIRPLYKIGLTFRDIFGFEPRDVQLSLIDAATEPGVYVLEAPMGIGKTEAALFAAYTLLSQNKASGIYFALPTQLTSNNIHDRMDEFLSQILSNESKYKSSLLLHSSAWLKEMGEDGQPGGEWFSSSKRQILAPFAVGTLDQALMACMNVKHGFVRAFGLMGKVVIIDEAHSYDTYTGTILDTLVSLLIELKCTVIVLSATLTNERRHKIASVPFRKALSGLPYPLVTKKVNNSNELVEVSPPYTESKSVSLKVGMSDARCFEEAILRAEQGQQVLWIENTVNEAQAALRFFTANARSVECGLLHSRFTKCQREKNETKWTSLFGKQTTIRGLAGRVLIGTQVVEQSLDIDADFVVSRFCPTDMLFQRMGRLWRHSRNDRHADASCEFWVMAPKLIDALHNPEGAFGPTALVYSPYVLCRSLQAWAGVSTVTIPHDMREFIERTYEERTEANDWAVLKNELNDGGTRNGVTRTGRNQLASFALKGISFGGKTLTEQAATTRYSTQDTIDCLLLASAPILNEKSTSLTLLNGESLTLPVNGKSLPKNTWRILAKKLAENVVCLSSSSAPKALPIDSLRWLRDYFYIGGPDDTEASIRVAYVCPELDVKNLVGTAHDKHSLKYSASLGFYINKNGDLV